MKFSPLDILDKQEFFKFEFRLNKEMKLLKLM